MHFEKLWQHEQRGSISSLDIAPDGSCVLAGTGDGQLVMYGADSVLRWRIALFQTILSVKLAEEGDYAVALLEDGSIQVYNGIGELHQQFDPVYRASVIDLRPGSNMIFAGNRYGSFRMYSIHGKVLGKGKVKHPIDYITYGPAGRRAAVASADGRVSLLGYKGELLWSCFVHRMVLGIDVAVSAKIIFAPSRERGLVALNGEGDGVGVYEMINPIVAAEISDRGERIVALEHSGRVLHMDREARLLAAQESGIKADRMALDNDGTMLAVSGFAEPDLSSIICMRLVQEDRERVEYLEVASREGELMTEDDVTTDYYIEV